jgi:hypothetical protein
VFVGDEGLRHNDTEPGILYVVADAVGPDDVTVDSDSVMEDNKEWVTKRPLAVTPIARPEILVMEFLTTHEIYQIQEHAGELTYERR